MKTIKFRDLLPSEIELRVGTVKDGKGFSLLLYKTARTDANILDETVGAFNWQKKFYQVKNTMICSLGINVNYNDETKEPLWIWKDDAGDESNQDAIKGEASDAFKRAGFAYSIGRKLYESPFVWIKQDTDNDKYSKYYVKEIAYDDTSVVKLVICNEKNNQVVYTYGTSQKVVKKGVSADLMRELQELGGNLEQVANWCKCKVEDLTDAEVKLCIEKVKKSRGIK